jgi:hypothetical protein
MEYIQRKPSASDPISFAVIISPINGRNIIKLNTTCKKFQNTVTAYSKQSQNLLPSNYKTLPSTSENCK